MPRYEVTTDFVDQFTGRSFKKGAGVRPFSSRSADLAEDAPDDRMADPIRFQNLLDRGLFREVDEPAEPEPKAAPAKAADTKAEGKGTA